jgi:hypothetical protein
MASYGATGKCIACRMDTRKNKTSLQINNHGAACRRCSRRGKNFDLGTHCTWPGACTVQ